MDKKTAGLIGAVAGLATMGVAQAATTPAVSSSQALQASSYADLLEPIPNAGALLQADNAARAQQPMNMSASFQLADWGNGYSRGNYHHHHQAYRNYGYYNRNNYHHHQYNRSNYHHHHHNQGTFVGIPGVGGFQVNGGR